MRHGVFHVKCKDEIKIKRRSRHLPFETGCTPASSSRGIIPIPKRPQQLNFTAKSRPVTKGMIFQLKRVDIETHAWNVIPWPGMSDGDNGRISNSPQILRCAELPKVWLPTATTCGLVEPRKRPTLFVVLTSTVEVHASFLLWTTVRDISAWLSETLDKLRSERSAE